MGFELYVPLALLFLAGAGSSWAQSAAPPASTDAAPAPTPAPAPPPPSVPLKLFYYDVNRAFALNCTVENPPAGSEYMWRKNGTALEQVADLVGRYTLSQGGSVLQVNARTHEDDFGNYTCGLVGVTDEVLGWDVRGRPVAKVAPTTNVVEGQKLRIVCKVTGKPYPPVEWRVRNGSTEDNSTVLAAQVLGERASLRASEQGVADAELVVEPVERDDAGVYQCVPLSVEGLVAETTLRVKDKYAALWPFLGICAEVFLLCAIILVYEKRRTKPELDDSDTDNHDQKKS